MEEYISTHIRLEKQQYNRLRDEAHETRRSQSEIIREALEMRWKALQINKYLTSFNLLIVPEKLHRQLKTRVAAEGTDISTVVRKMLEKYLASFPLQP